MAMLLFDNNLMEICFLAVVQLLMVAYPALKWTLVYWDINQIMLWVVTSYFLLNYLFYIVGIIYHYLYIIIAVWIFSYSPAMEGFTSTLTRGSTVVSIILLQRSMVDC